jgi:flagellar protein FliO/FliZ
MTIQTIISTCAALAGVVFLVLLGGRVARQTRFARPQGNGRMRIEESLALDTRRRLLLVSCDGRAVLLLTGPQDQVVGWLPEHTS